MDENKPEPIENEQWKRQEMFADDLIARFRYHEKENDLSPIDMLGTLLMVTLDLYMQWQDPPEFVIEDDGDDDDPADDWKQEA